MLALVARAALAVPSLAAPPTDAMLPRLGRPCSLSAMLSLVARAARTTASKPLPGDEIGGGSACSAFAARGACSHASVSVSAPHPNRPGSSEAAPDTRALAARGGGAQGGAA
jgi:hypothetical protein